MTTHDRPSTPYRPVASTGLGGSVLGWLHSLFAPATPAYRGGGQPVARGGGVFGGTPSYGVPSTSPPPKAEPEPEIEMSTPSQGNTDCCAGAMTIVIDARD